MKNSISIIGLGWLGLPLYHSLINSGYLVKGTKTNLQDVNLLQLENINVFHLDLIPQIVSLNISEILNADILIINIPPNRKREDAGEFFYSQIKNLLEEVCVSKIKHVLFISSTSVYGDSEGIKNEETETSPNTSSADGLVHVEKLLQEQTSFSTTIIRFGGLVGPKRNPAKFLKESRIHSGAEAAVNLIHQKDCISIIEKIIEDKCWGEIFNAVTDGHPTRKDYYSEMAKKENLPLPQFDNFDSKKGKIITAEKIKKLLHYTFQFPDPLGFTF